VPKRDYYEVLGIARTADAREIKAAYRKLALKYHPDRNPGDTEAEERFKEAAEAYEVLADEQKRAIYDRAGFEGLRSGGFQGFNGDLGDIFSQFGDIFSEFFGGGGFGGFGGGFGGGFRGPRPMAGADLHAQVAISLEQALTGTSNSITVDRTRPCEACDATGAEGGRMASCPACGGRGQIVQGRGAFMIATTCRACGGVGKTPEKQCEACGGQAVRSEARKLEIRVPAGVYSGLRLRVPGEGNAGLHGGPPGDLYVLIDVQPHETFVRDGPDLHCELGIGFSLACLGGRVDVPRLDGETEAIEVPAGSQPGDVLRVHRAGLPRIEGGGMGDMLVHLTVQVPKRLDKEQEKLVRSIGEKVDAPPHVTAGGPNRRETTRRRKKGGFFGRLRDALEGEG
jgi:molecular chaperone DnaJ